MYAIITVTGQDHTGIVAAVATELARNEVNIHNVSQTIMDGFFTMILHVAFDEEQLDTAALRDALRSVEEDQDLVIRIQSDALFTAVNEI